MPDPIAQAQSSFQEGNLKKALIRMGWARAQLDFDNSVEVDTFLRLAETIRDAAAGSELQQANELLAEARTRVAEVEGLRELPRPRRMPIATTPTIPGYEVVGYVGEVFGVIVRSRGAFPAMGAGLKSVVGGELKTMTNQLHDSRRQAIARMVAEAEARGADGIVSMRFDAEALGDTWSEVCAYGTAVRLRELATPGQTSKETAD